MGNHTDLLTYPTLQEFVCTKFRVGDDCIPVIGGITEATNPVVGVHGHVTHELKAHLFMEISDTTVLFVDDPAVVDGKDKIWPYPLNNLTDTVFTKRCLLESIRSRKHLELLLDGIWVPMPVAAKDYDFVFVLETLNNIMGDACKTSGCNNVPHPQELWFFIH
jgi:hypothetical protein